MKVGRTFLSAHVNVFLSIEADWRGRQATMPPRIWAAEGFPRTPTREDGRFFAALRVTCFLVDILEMSRSYPRQTCHPEEADLPASDSSAGWLTKDLLRHRLIPERLLSFAVTRQAARLRLHGQADQARVMMSPPKLSGLEIR